MLKLLSTLSKRSGSTSIANYLACGTLPLLLLVLLLVSAISHAETYYKWQNERGTWEYGTHPPVNTPAIKIKTSANKARPKSSTAAPSPDQAPFQAPGSLEAEFEQKQKLSKQRSDEYCTTAKANLESLNSKALIRRRDANNEVTILSEEERQAEINKAEVAIGRYCR